MKLKDLTEQEFSREITSRGWTYTRCQAMSGSMYLTVNGILRFRISDHFNPNNKFEGFEVSYFIDIIKIAAVEMIDRCFGITENGKLIYKYLTHEKVNYSYNLCIESDPKSIYKIIKM